MEKELGLLKEMIREQEALLRILGENRTKRAESLRKKTEEDIETLIRIRETVMTADQDRRGSSQLTHDETEYVRRIIKELCPDFKL